MKILIDLGHPAHIHYFKNFIKIMESKGHRFELVARDKEVLHALLKKYNFSYTTRGKGGNNLLSKLFYILKADAIIYRVAQRFKPDVFLSFASTYAAHAASLMRKPHIALDDTEHAKFELLMYPPFTSTIINPKSFLKKFSPKQIFIDTFFELNYLHPQYFTPDAVIPAIYNIDVTTNYFILRFVSWNASHDVGEKGMSNDLKIRIAEKLATKGNLIISSEVELPDALKKYQVKIDPAHLHHLLAFAALYLGEGATTASEAIALGVPTIYINSLDAGTLQEQSEKFGLISLRNGADLENVLGNFLLNIDDNRDKMKKNREKLINSKIDGTRFLVWFVENYPNSVHEMKVRPEVQYSFK
jgi:predicted glycosyltransferase